MGSRSSLGITGKDHWSHLARARSERNASLLDPAAARARGGDGAIVVDELLAKRLSERLSRCEDVDAESSIDERIRAMRESSLLKERQSEITPALARIFSERSQKQGEAGEHLDELVRERRPASSIAIKDDALARRLRERLEKAETAQTAL